ncbi:MAG: SMC-Scp complex subunit ScpB [Firmicutes bacterium]|nr:SMC-Scp complex subunit ScpB [Bacillota bacterium]
MKQRNEITETIEAILFASGEGKPVTEIVEGLKYLYTPLEINEAIREVRERFSGDRGIILIEYNGKLQLQSNPRYGELLSEILKKTREREISKAVLTVLAIIAYKQPITRLEVEDIRGGVSPDYAISKLLEQDLIEPKGRKEALGNPILYGTSDEFLRKFGLVNLSELPDFELLMNKIRNNYEKYHAKSEGLYRERNIEEEERASKINTDFPEEDITDEDESDDPDFLSGEDFVDTDED